MPFDREQPGPYKRGDKIPTSGEVNQIIKGGRRQIGGPGVQEYGDRVVINQPTPFSQRGLRQPTSDTLQKFVVLNVYDDYLLCKVIEYGVNPTTHWWTPYAYEEISAEPSYKYIYLAKPDEIRRSFWDGKTMNVNGEMVTYAHVNEGVRTANGITETLTQPYYPGCVVSGVKGFTGVSENTNKPVFWTDANTAGRHWHRSDGDVWILIEDPSDETLGDTDTDPACPMSTGSVVNIYDDCSLQVVSSAFVIPLNPGLFQAGYIYRAWPALASTSTDTDTDTDTDTSTVPIYVADPGSLVNCGDYYTGSQQFVTNVSVVCVNGVITTTQTKVTVEIVCGRIVSIT
jgi:hypothetical protein